MVFRIDDPLLSVHSKYITHSQADCVIKIRFEDTSSTILNIRFGQSRSYGHTRSSDTTQTPGKVEYIKSRITIDRQQNY